MPRLARQTPPICQTLGLPGGLHPRRGNQRVARVRSPRGVLVLDSPSDVLFPSPTDAA